MEVVGIRDVYSSTPEEQLRRFVWVREYSAPIPGASQSNRGPLLKNVLPFVNLNDFSSLFYFKVLKKFITEFGSYLRSVTIKSGSPFEKIFFSSFIFKFFFTSFILNYQQNSSPVSQERNHKIGRPLFKIFSPL